MFPPLGGLRTIPHTLQFFNFAMGHKVRQNTDAGRITACERGSRIVHLILPGFPNVLQVTYRTQGHAIPKTVPNKITQTLDPLG